MSVRAGLFMGLVILLAAGLRMREARARTSLYGDEVQTVEIARGATSLPQLLDTLMGEGHPPLVYLIDYLAIRAGLETDAQLRALRVIAGTLAVALLMALLARLFGPHAALAGGLVMAASPFFIQQSTDIRSYALFTLLSVAHLGAVVWHGTRRRAGTAIAWGVVAGLMCSLHYYAIHQVVAAGFFLLWHDRTRAGFGRVVLAGLSCVAVFTPWLGVLRSAAGQGSTTNWYVHDVGWGQLWLFAEAGVGGGLTFGIVLWAMANGWKDRFANQAATVIALGSALSAWLLHLYHGPYLARYLCGAAAVALVPLGFSLGRLLESAKARLVGFALLGTVLVSQQVSGDRWRRSPGNADRVAAAIERGYRPGDEVWIYPEFDAVTVRYHLDPSIPIHVLGRAGAPRWVNVADRWEQLQRIDLMERDVRAARALMRDGRRVWFVSQFLGDWAAKHPVDRGHCVPDESPLSRPEVRAGMRVWRAFDSRGRSRHILGGGDDAQRLSIALMLVEPNEAGK